MNDATLPSSLPSHSDDSDALLPLHRPLPASLCILMGKKRGGAGRSNNEIKPTYRFARGQRAVVPYVYEFATHAKGRWLGSTLIQVFEREFGAFPTAYYKAAIASGRITVNDRVVKPDHSLRNGDHIVHRTHRHEPPVSGVLYADMVRRLSLLQWRWR